MPARQPCIPQRVDEQRRAVADHQNRIALAEQSVRLQPGVNTRADLGKASLEPRRTGMKGRAHGHERWILIQYVGGARICEEYQSRPTASSRVIRFALLLSRAGAGVDQPSCQR
jgi:hypothetical protein